ncbi:MAG: IPT/TIG domain-containing protein, partial [Paludibacter sp.]|nr:IPT/TIG domain-containing protein [Paludibacter sp.]
MKTDYSTKCKSKRKKARLFFVMWVPLFFIFGLGSCNNEGDTPTTPVPADGNKATAITSFTPDSGGIATPMIIVGDNFGTDTAKIKVYFKSGNDSIQASIIHSNGSRIYLVVPKLTYLENLEVIVKVTADNQNVRVNKFTNHFKYKTQTTVTTVAGTMFPDVSVALSRGGTLSTASFSCPMFLCVDAEKNVIIVERLFDKVPPEMDVRPLRPRSESGTNMNGDFLMLNEANNSVVFMKNAGMVINAPTVSPDGFAIYVPTDAGADYFQMLRSENYAPRQKRIKITSENSSITNKNWKFSFVTNPENGLIYTVMYNKQLV